MTGPEHYVQAEMLLAGCGFRDAEDPGAVDETVIAGLAAAQVHATLALAAATAMPRDSYAKAKAWEAVTGDPR